MERPQSEFNMAVSYLNRLNSLFYVCNEASMSLNIYQWYHTLRTLLRELSTELTKEEITEWNGKAQKLNGQIALYLQDQKKRPTGVPDRLYEELNNFELFLRKISKDSGLLLKVMDSPDQALK